MNAIELLTREKLNCQNWLDQYYNALFQTKNVNCEGYEKVRQELANIERALETLEAEAQRKAGVK